MLKIIKKRCYKICFVLAILSIACLILGVSSMNFTKSYAETPTSGIIADFTSDDTVKLKTADGMPKKVAGQGLDTLYSTKSIYVTDVDTDGDGVIDAENAFKADYSGYTSAWITFGMKFNNPVKLSDVANVKIRYYAHVTKNTLVFFAGANDNYVTRVNSTDWVSVKKNTWVTETISSDKLSYLADANGDISSIGVAVGNSGGGNFDTNAYVLFDSVSYTINVTIDNDTANTGIENVTYETEVGKISKPDTVGVFGYDLEYFADKERTVPFDFDAPVSKNTVIYAKQSKVQPVSGYLTEFTPGDTRKLDSSEIPLSIAGQGVDRLYNSKFSFVTEVDTDADGVIDAKSAIKADFSGYTSAWITFGVKFATPVAVDTLAKIDIRYYANFDKNTILLVAGENDGYTSIVNSPNWVSVAKKEWKTETINADKLAKLADSKGKISTLAFAVGTNGGDGKFEDSNAYFLFDNITYEEKVVIDYEEGMIADFTKHDSFYANLRPAPPNHQYEMLSKQVSYVEDVDVNGDSVVDAENAMKITGFKEQYAFVGIKFENKVKREDVAAVTIRYYANFTNEVSLLVFGPGDDYTTDLNYGVNENGVADYTRVVSGEWYEQTLRTDKLECFGDKDGYVSSLILMFAYHDRIDDPDYDMNYNQDAFFLLDSLTYTAGATITFDNEFTVTGEENTSVTVVRGDKITRPASQVYGYAVEWYSDLEKTTLFDFTKPINEHVIIYGRYTAVDPQKGVIAEFNGADSRYKTLADRPFNDFFEKVEKESPNSKLGQSHFSYVTDVDMDGDGVVDVKDALKITGLKEVGVTWLYFALEFASPVNVADIASIKINYFAHLSKNVTMVCAGAKDNFQAFLTSSEIPMTQDDWSVLEIGGEFLKGLADENGNITTIAFALGYRLPYHDDAYLYLDSITYDYNCVITFDHDKENTGLENTTEIITSGKRLLKPKSKLVGYEAEWFIDGERTIPYDFKTNKVTEDMTLYAVYSVKKLTVTFDFDKATTGIDSIEKVINYNEKILPPETMVNGKEVKWYVDVNCLEEFDFETPVISDMTLYGKVDAPEKEGVPVGTIIAISAGGCAIAAGAVFATILIKKKKIK